MYVPHKMEEKFQRHDPLFRSCGRVRQLCSKLVDFIDNTIFSWPYRGGLHGGKLWVTEACLIDIRSPELDIDEMPAPGRLVTDLHAEPIGVPISVCPGCLICDVMHRRSSGSAARSARTLEPAAGMRNRSAIRAMMLCPSSPHARAGRDGTPLPIDMNSST